MGKRTRDEGEEENNQAKRKADERDRDILRKSTEQTRTPAAGRAAQLIVSFRCGRRPKGSNGLLVEAQDRPRSKTSPPIPRAPCRFKPRGESRPYCDSRPESDRDSFKANLLGDQRFSRNASAFRRCAEAKHKASTALARPKSLPATCLRPPSERRWA